DGRTRAWGLRAKAQIYLTLTRIPHRSSNPSSSRAPNSTRLLILPHTESCDIDDGRLPRSVRDRREAPLMDSPASKTSLSQRTIDAGRAALSGGRRGLRALLPFAGPAIIASVAYMDPGNFATNIEAGAKYGFTLLWVVLAANLIAMLFQSLSAKLGIVT